MAVVFAVHDADTLDFGQGDTDVIQPVVERLLMLSPELPDHPREVGTIGREACPAPVRRAGLAHSGAVQEQPLYARVQQSFHVGGDRKLLGRLGEIPQGRSPRAERDADRPSLSRLLGYFDVEVVLSFAGLAQYRSRSSPSAPISIVPGASGGSGKRRGSCRDRSFSRGIRSALSESMRIPFLPSLMAIS